jgi:hypothetical protein
VSRDADCRGLRCRGATCVAEVRHRDTEVTIESTQTGDLVSQAQQEMRGGRAALGFDVLLRDASAEVLVLRKSISVYKSCRAVHGDVRHCMISKCCV